MACSSIPKASPPSMAMRCSPTSSNWQALRRDVATVAPLDTPPEIAMDLQPSQELRQLIQKVSQGATLSEDEIRTALDQMTAGAATPAQMGAFLMALRVRGETVEEITGAAQMLRARMQRVAGQEDAVAWGGTGRERTRADTGW